MSCSHLAQVRYGEAECGSVSRAGIHVVPDKKDDLQQLGKGLAFPELLAGSCHSHHIWLDVVQLLLKLQLEQDGLKSWHQTLHTGHLEKPEYRGLKGSSFSGGYQRVNVLTLTEFMYLFLAMKRALH